MNRKEKALFNEAKQKRLKILYSFDKKHKKLARGGSHRVSSIRVCCVCGRPLTQCLNPHGMADSFKNLVNYWRLDLGAGLYFNLCYHSPTCCKHYIKRKLKAN